MPYFLKRFVTVFKSLPAALPGASSRGEFAEMTLSRCIQAYYVLSEVWVQLSRPPRHQLRETGILTEIKTSPLADLWTELSNEKD
jgi:hypothetical protein